MRRHGWELPYHPLQVVAVAVFFALVFAFYVFYIPFVGNRILEFLIIALYSPTVITVFVLYVCCVATNPADLGVFKSKKFSVSSGSNKKPSSVTSSRVDAERDQHQAETQKAHGVSANGSSKQHGLYGSLALASLPGVAFFSEHCTPKSSTDLPSSEDGMLYCSLCEVEIFKCSKHCRVCDKCVDGFDHHCRWLNNCVGRRNYKGFVVLMISGLVMLILQWSVGLWVVVHCFLNLRQFQGVIALKLGSSFSSVAYIIVVALCTVLAMVATLPLAQLFCFHVILIKKGISTYDYIVAMREQEQKVGAGEGAQSPLTSPASSVTTANSGASSAGVLQGRAWCTPPRLFFDHEQGVFTSDSSLSTRDIDLGVATRASTAGNSKRKPPVKINPWALASLNKQDVVRAAALARSKSSILRPVSHGKNLVVAETDSSFDSSSRDISTEFIASLGNRRASRKLDEPFSHIQNIQDQSLLMSSWHNGKLPLDSFEQVGSSGNDSVNLSQHNEIGNTVLNPLQMEARNAFHASHAFCAGGFIASSPESSVASSGARHSRASQLDLLELPHPSAVPTDWPWTQRPASDGYDTSGGESAEDSDGAKILPHSWSKQKLHPDYVNRGELIYSPVRKVTGHDSSIPFIVNNPRRVDESREEASIMTYVDQAIQEHPPNMITTVEDVDYLPSQMSSRERTRISKYLGISPSG